MPPKSLATGGRRIQARRSSVHGKGVFALQDIAEGETLIEYLGEVITWKEAQRRHPHDPDQPNHTFYFHVDDKHVIDGARNGNMARWINHACDPNCEADEVGGRVFVKALRDIAAGEELNYDYGLVIEEPYTKALKAEYLCLCGSPQCRGTMLAPKSEQLAHRKSKEKTAKADKAKVKDKVKAKAKKADKPSKAKAGKDAKAVKAKKAGKR